MSLSTGAGTATSTGSVVIKTPTSGSAGVSGRIAISTGNSQTGSSGMLTMTTGAATTGRGGSMTFSVGSSNQNAGGDISMTAGTTSDTTGGSISLTTGAGTTKSSGAVVVKTPDAGTLGVSGHMSFLLEQQVRCRSIFLTTCGRGAADIVVWWNSPFSWDKSAVTGGAVSSLRGGTATSSGAVVLKTSDAGVDGVSGLMSFTTGTTSSGSSGLMQLNTGNAAGSGKAGSITVSVGTADQNEGGRIAVSAGTTSDTTGGLISLRSGATSGQCCGAKTPDASGCERTHVFFDWSGDARCFRSHPA